MNAKTAKLIRRAAPCLVLIEVSRREAGKHPSQRMSPERKQEVIRASTERTRKALMCRWRGMPHNKRHPMRRYLERVVRDTHGALLKAAHGLATG